jgi:hypothetical protein
MKKISFIYQNIKRNAVLFAATLFSMGLVSCNDWLEMPSYNTSDTETVFADEKTADMYVQGCYRGLIHQEMYYQLGMGETVMHSSEDGATNNSKYNVCNYFFDSSSPYTVTTIFKEQYRIIEATNIAVYQLNKMADTEKRNSMLGEVLAIRAFCYYNLIRIYGDVPAVWEPLETMNPNDENTFYPKRTSRDVIYDRIIADLQFAANNVPWASESKMPTYERLTKQGVYALLARVALYAGGYSLRWDLATNDPATMKMSTRSDNAKVKEFYQIANDACKAVISKGENGLVQEKAGMNGFHYLWYNFCQRNFSETNPEILWELAQYGENTNSNFGVLAHPGTRGGVFGSRKAMQFMLPSYYLSFDKNDTRRDVSCTSYSIYFLNKGASDDTWIDVGTTYSCIMPGKFRISWCVEPYGASERNLNIPVIRYADLLLMYAETQNYLNNGPTAEAIAALKQVRDRAGIGSMPIPTDSEGFVDAIVQERKWEFAGEFNLRTDLIRMNRLAKELKATQQMMKDLSDRKNSYASTPVYRLYKLHKDAQKYGDKFLALDYIEIVDQSEINVIQNVPTKAADYDAFQAQVADIVRAHGITVENGDKWYPVNMFEGYTSSYNGNSRKSVGFTNGFNALQIGNIIYTKPTGSAENGGKYPNWIEAEDGSDGLYYGFIENCAELMPFASKTAGHPLVDNPNLTQHPGYK